MRFGKALVRVLSFASILFLASGPPSFADRCGVPAEGAFAGSTTANVVVQSTWPIRNGEDPVSIFIQSLGRRLTDGACSRKSITWSFHVVRDLALKAFSVRGGSVYVSDGAIATVSSESELAAILAHEIGHHLAGHFQGTNNSPGIFHGNNFFFFFSRTPGSAPKNMSLPDGSLKQIDSPEREYEADEYALTVLGRSGYNPQGLLDLIRRLGPDAPSRGVSLRITRIERELFRKTPATKYPPESDDFLKIQAKIRKDWKDLNLNP